MFMGNSMQAQAWLDSQLYPFAQQTFQLEAGKMHYVDEGEGETILFVHGTPTWSFLYRDFIKKFSKSHRCIAIDHLGFGLSEKPLDFSGKPEAHARNLAAFIEGMDLKDITLVVHDFGGPIGLGAAVTMPQRIKRVVLFNSWLWETKDNPAVQKVDRILNGFMGRFLYLRMNFSPKVLLKKGFADKKKLEKAVHRHYIRPFPDKDARQSLLRIGQALLGSSDWYQEQWEKLDVLLDKPWLILWGMKDSFITPEYLEKWKERMPNATVEPLDCGHFVQEEGKERAIQLMGDFLGK